ncbi:MAG: DUF4351 domain-containing protein [Fibrella sp.]|nr:DUF4351 domain-containing protein [Armatimonadota bacterium]
MPKPYDAVTKRLIELRPAEWVRFLGLPPGNVSLVDADLSTITSYADRIIRVDTDAGSYLVHNELESGKDTATVPVRLFHYNASAVYKTGLPVVSTVFLLHKKSNSPQITGVFDVTDISGNVYLAFRYNVVRVWQLDVDELLAGGIATLPFAPVANVRPTELPRVIKAMQARIEAEAESDAEAAELWMATNILMGLRYNQSFRTQLLQGVRRMRESDTYQQILNEGRTEGRVEGRVEGRLQEARRMVVRAGRRRLGEATLEVETRLESVASLAQLETLVERVFDVETWDDLLIDLPE